MPKKRVMGLVKGTKNAPAEVHVTCVFDTISGMWAPVLGIWADGTREGAQDRIDLVNAEDSWLIVGTRGYAKARYVGRFVLAVGGKMAVDEKVPDPKELFIHAALAYAQHTEEQIARGWWSEDASDSFEGRFREMARRLRLEPDYAKLKPGVKKARPCAKVVVRRVDKKITWLVVPLKKPGRAHAYVEGHERSVCGMYLNLDTLTPKHARDEKCATCTVRVRLAKGGKR